MRKQISDRLSDSPKSPARKRRSDCAMGGTGTPTPHLTRTDMLPLTMLVRMWATIPVENDGKCVSKPEVKCEDRCSVINMTCGVFTRSPTLVMVCQSVPHHPGVGTCSPNRMSQSIWALHISLAFCLWFFLGLWNSSSSLGLEIGALHWSYQDDFLTFYLGKERSCFPSQSSTSWS